MKKMDLDGTLSHRVGKDLSPKTPGRAYPYLLRLVQYLEKELPDVPHYYKGGFFIGEYTKEPRYTQDVDMSVVELSAYDRVKEVLAKLGDEMVASGEISSYAVKDCAAEASSGGAKYYAPDGSILFSTDIGYQEVPCKTVTVNFTGVGTLQVSTVEQMLCDKLRALFSNKRFRRCKDLYDAWHLITTCSVDKEQVILLLNKEHSFPLPSEQSPFALSVIDRMEKSYGRLAVAYVGENKFVELPSFSDVAQVLNAFFEDLTDAEV